MIVIGYKFYRIRRRSAGAEINVMLFD